MWSMILDPIGIAMLSSRARLVYASALTSLADAEQHFCIFSMHCCRTTLSSVPTKHKTPRALTQATFDLGVPAPPALCIRALMCSVQHSPSSGPRVTTTSPIATLANSTSLAFPFCTQRSSSDGTVSLTGSSSSYLYELLKNAHRVSRAFSLVAALFSYRASVMANNKSLSSWEEASFQEGGDDPKLASDDALLLSSSSLVMSGGFFPPPPLFRPIVTDGVLE
mmetsp:Transcript_5/g.13  ORF Transcript_5/g.13 Transcript_5/m.13 type:complete len:223 (+) Transcript_5:117-785(+)